MSEYKRLTERHENGYIELMCNSCKYNDKCDVETRYCNEAVKNRLAELEDKIENGALYDFPFRIGQEVYIVCDWDIGEAVKGIITEIELTTNKNGTFHRIYVEHKYIFSKTNPNVVKHRYIFTKKELFLTKAEAEVQLKELQKSEVEE